MNTITTKTMQIAAGKPVVDARALRALHMGKNFDPPQLLTHAKTLRCKIFVGSGKTILALHIIITHKRPERAFCGSSRLEISLVFLPITFLTKELL